jgi:hypothetical protein
MMHGRKTVDAPHTPASSGSAGIPVGACLTRCDSHAGRDAGAPGDHGHHAVPMELEASHEPPPGARTCSPQQRTVGRLAHDRQGDCGSRCGLQIRAPEDGRSADLQSAATDGRPASARLSGGLRKSLRIANPRSVKREVHPHSHTGSERLVGFRPEWYPCAVTETQRRWLGSVVRDGLKTQHRFSAAPAWDVAGKRRLESEGANAIPRIKRSLRQRHDRLPHPPVL